MKNYYNILIDKTECDDKELNFKESLKFNKFGIKINNILNTWKSFNLDFEVYLGFNCKSSDELISSFRKIQLKINNSEFNKLISKCIEENYNIEYDKKSEILTLMI